jgi:O-antigen/teichoic acid export membrane protein
MGALSSTIRYVRLAFVDRPVARHTQRDIRVVQGIFSALANKGIAVLISFISVPLTVRYLGAERYGAWVTISTAMAWLALADFGLSNSLTNVVSEGYAADNKEIAQASVAAAFWTLTGIALVLGLIFFAMWSHVPWDRVFNVQSAQTRAEVGPAVATAFLIFFVNFPFSIVAKVYGAYQEVNKSNAWATSGNLLGLAGLVTVTHLKGGLVPLVIAVSGAALFVNTISAIWLFGWSKPWLRPRPGRVTWSATRKLASLGGMFFVIQIAALVLFQTDNLIIAHYLGAAAVTPYSVTWRLFTYTALFQILAGPSYWPAYTEAFSKGDLGWVRSRYHTNLRITIASTLMLALPLVLFGRWIIDKWAGSAAVPPRDLLVWMGIWSVIYGAMNSQSCLLASSGRIRIQMIYSVLASAVNLILSIVLVQKLGLVGVIMGTLGAFLTCVVVPQSLEVERSMRTSENPHGLGNMNKRSSKAQVC